jgi:hypothetical protein
MRQAIDESHVLGTVGSRKRGNEARSVRVIFIATGFGGSFAEPLGSGWCRRPSEKDCDEE